MIHRHLASLLLAAALLPALAPARADAQPRRERAAYRNWVDTTVAFARGGTVDLGGLAGDVVVTAWDRDELRVRAYAEHGRVEASLSRTRAAVRLEGEGSSRRGRLGDAGIVVTVPVGTRVRAVTTAGDVTVTDTRGEVEASSNAGDVAVTGARGLTTLASLSGDVVAVDIDGDVAASTAGGDLMLRDVRGDVRAVSVGGDLVLMGVASRVVSARSTGGDVLFTGAPAAGGRYEFASHSGDVVLALPEDARADVSVQTYKGSLDTAFPVVIGGGVAASRPRVMEFPIGGGGARLRVETFSGDVVLRRQGDRRDDRRAGRDRRD